MKGFRHFALLLISFFLIFSAISVAQVSGLQNISPQQIEQFKRLPVAQQRALAQQLGIDFNQINAIINQQGASSPSNGSNPDSLVFPRGTQFDQFGNPISKDFVDQYLEIEKDELKPFGYELFAGAPSTFAPTYDAPVPASYILGPGDTVVLQLYGKESMQHQLKIDRQGFLVIPELEPIKLAGLTFSEAKSFVSSKIRQNMLGIESHLSMGELRSMRIFVLGEAFKPGAYTVSSLTTMTQALFVSGGVNDIASLRNIQLKRAGTVIQELDLYDLLNFGDTSDDALLQPGDVVFIPTVEKTVSVTGNVRRPAIYELKDETSFEDAIELAGGFTSDAFASLVNVLRTQGGKVNQLTIPEEELDGRVLNGDVIDVSGVSDNIEDAITFVGAVARPGKYQWRNGVSLSSFFKDRNKDLLVETDLNYGLVLRNYRTGKALSILQFSPLMLIAGDVSQDIPLRPDDFVVFFSRDEVISIGDDSLDKLAKTKEALQKQEKEAWRERIEQRLFWQELGFEVESPDNNRRNIEQSDAEPIIALTELEKENLSRMKDATAFSRKRLLAPIIEQLRSHASFDDPLRLVEISGSVQHPGLYPLPDNGTVEDIFIAAGGLSESAFGHLSELTRYTTLDDGKMVVENHTFKPVDVVAGTEIIKLKSRDRINVYQNPEWQEQLQVHLKGEVAFPGTYTFRRGETIASVLQRAGGLTQFADANASIFLRESLKRQESENLAKLTEDLRKEIASEGLRSKSGAGSLVSYSEVQKLLSDLTDVEAVGRLVIDLPAILAGADDKDFPLEKDDTLVVPGENKTVNVIGEVFVPTSHLFQNDASYSDYIELSGGFRQFAADERTYIIKANGAVVVPKRDSDYWFQASNQRVLVEPGDTIVVPYDSGHIDNLTLWTSASQIAYQLAVTIAALGSL